MLCNTLNKALSSKSLFLGTRKSEAECSTSFEAQKDTSVATVLLQNCYSRESELQSIMVLLGLTKDICKITIRFCKDTVTVQLEYN